MSLPLRFGPCWLDSVLASGQSSLLFRAHPAVQDASAAGRELVVKVPYLYLQRNSGFRQIFHDRMLALGGLSHPGLVPVEVSGRALNLVWAASPWLDAWNAGNALEAIRRGGPRLTPRQALAVGIRLAEALEALHATETEAGPLVHGELRPGKVLFLRDGTPKLLVASAVTAAAGERSSASSAEKFAWRAPEQLLRQPETVETDIRGLALLIFVLMTGSNPFQRRTTASTCSAILQDQVLFEGDAAIPSELSALLRAAMSSNPERRPYHEMSGFTAALRAALATAGGEEGWQGWLTQLWQSHPVSDEEARPNPERDALLARLVRDAPRSPEMPEPARAEPHRPEPTRPARVEPPPPERPRPEPVRPASAREEPAAVADSGSDQEPTVLLGGRGRRDAARPEPSGFTLVPDDVHEEQPTPSVVRIEQLARRAPPPPELDEPRTVERPLEVQAEWTGELTAEHLAELTAERTSETTGEWTREPSYEPSQERTAERTEDLPAPERRARRTARVFGAAPEVDSSFVLVTDERPANAGVVITTHVSGQREALPERVPWPPEGSQAQASAGDEDFIPALSEEECLAELALEQAARAEEEEELDEAATPIGEVIAPPLPPVAQVTTRPAPAPPETAAVVQTLPTVVNQPSPLRGAEAAPPPPPTPPPPLTPAMPPRQPLPQPVQAHHKGLMVAIALVALLLVALGLKAAGVLDGPAEEVAASDGAGAQRATGPVTGGTEAATSAGVEVGSGAGTPDGTSAATQQGGDAAAQQGGDAAAQQGGDAATQQGGDAAAQQGGDAAAQQASAASAGTTTAAGTPGGGGERGGRAAQQVSGPPGLIALRADSGTDTRQDIRGTMRGSFGRPTTTRAPGAGVNGGDQYQLTFSGTESQMKLTRVNITSPLVSSVQIVSGPGTLTLLVNVSAGSSVSYDVLPSGREFRIRVTRPAPP